MRAAGEPIVPPPATQAVEGSDGTVCASHVEGRSMNALSPGPGVSSLPLLSLTSGVFGPLGSVFTLWP